MAGYVKTLAPGSSFFEGVGGLLSEETSVVEGFNPEEVNQREKPRPRSGRNRNE